MKEERGRVHPQGAAPSSACHPPIDMNAATSHSHAVPSSVVDGGAHTSRGRHARA